MEHSTENLEQISAAQQPADEEKKYTPRPLWHIILAWFLIAVVLFGFFGVCYWMVMYGRV